MKQYDLFQNGQLVGSWSETAIDPGYKAQGLTDGSLIERDASYEEELSDCYRQRVLEYPSLATQADAAFHSRQGDVSQQESIDAQILAVKAKYPKPTPSSEAPNEPAQ